MDTEEEPRTIKSQFREKDDIMNWKREIRILGNDFCVSRQKVEAIISTVEERFKGENKAFLYREAWRKIFPLLAT